MKSMAKPWVDLSRVMNPSMPSYPGDAPFQSFLRDIDGFRVGSAHLNMHHGTHVDGALHAMDGETPIGSIPLDHFYGLAQKLKITPQEGIVTTRSLRDAFDASDEVEIILIDTGWGEIYGSERYYWECPRFQHDVIDVLRTHHIKLLGLDLPSVEIEGWESLLTHQEIMKTGCVIVENLCHMDHIDTKIEFMALPLPFTSLEASPVRAIARNR